MNIFGTLFQGKQEIEERHIKILETFLKDSVFKVLDTDIREAATGVVIAHVYWQVDNVKIPGNDSQVTSMKGIFTHVILQILGEWQIHSSQNTLIKGD